MNAQDKYTQDLFEELFAPSTTFSDRSTSEEVAGLFATASSTELTGPVVTLFSRLLDLRRNQGVSPADLGLSRKSLEELAAKHQAIDEHEVSIGGRVGQARSIAAGANQRVREYLQRHPVEAPSGMELWDSIRENQERIRSGLSMSDEEWNSSSGQLRHVIEDVETLARLIHLPDPVMADVARVTKTYRMRMTPYYASLIQPDRVNDPVLLQSVPTGEMVDNVGAEIPPVAADHSPARLIDQFYPRVVTIKATNMCAMYCTHCLRIAHIGKKDRIYSKDAYTEALEYIRANPAIRDVLVTGGDALVLPNSMLRWLLSELDAIEHVRMKRLGSRIPVTTPQRIDPELLDILEESNDKKPLRVVTQINTAQEITPVSREAFKRISGRVSAVMNQAVLLKGINDTNVKMWKLCETIQEAYVRPYYIFNCSYRNPQFAHLRVPVEVGRDIVESMYGNISGDAIPRYIATAGGKIPLHRDNLRAREEGAVVLEKPWSGEQVNYPDADPSTYADKEYAFARFKK
ncbi:MAG: KamA family radical SAM protein [Desulfovibrionales bacterium]